MWIEAVRLPSLSEVQRWVIVCTQMISIPDVVPAGM
jgi:hypothetical protein